MGGRHASARSSALAHAATASDVIAPAKRRTYVVKNQFGRPLGLGGSTG
jgi:hypothetical protein